MRCFTRVAVVPQYIGIEPAVLRMDAHANRLQLSSGASNKDSHADAVIGINLGDRGWGYLRVGEDLFVQDCSEIGGTIAFRGVIDAPPSFGEWDDAILVDSEFVLLWAAGGGSMALYSILTGQQITSVLVPSVENAVASVAWKRRVDHSGRMFVMLPREQILRRRRSADNREVVVWSLMPEKSTSLLSVARADITFGGTSSKAPHVEISDAAGMARTRPFDALCWCTRE